MPVAIYYNTEAMIQHRPPSPTSEEPARIVAVEAVLKNASVRQALQELTKDPSKAPEIPVRPGSIWSSCRIVEVRDSLTDAEITKEYGSKALRNAIHKTPFSYPQIDPHCEDIYWATGTWMAAKTAAAAAVQATQAILTSSTVEHAFCIVRPPGHHCLTMPSGFCFLNNVVLAARTLLAAGKRVAILDWDYHFGDGTANALWGEEVMFVSLHAAQTRSGFPTYPANNARDMKGDGLRRRSKGRSFNVQWPVDDADDAAYAYAFRRLILPALEQFTPDAILISAGYDAIRGDSLAGMELSAEAFGFLARALTTLGKPIVAILEGGYDVNLLAAGVANTILGLQHSPLFDSFEQWMCQKSTAIHRQTVDDVGRLVLNGLDLSI